MFEFYTLQNMFFEIYYINQGFLLEEKFIRIRIRIISTCELNYLIYVLIVFTILSIILE